MKCTLYAHSQSFLFVPNPSELPIRYLDHGDLSNQMALRNTCHSWSWYMAKVVDNALCLKDCSQNGQSVKVASLTLKHHPAPPPNIAWGEICQILRLILLNSEWIVMIAMHQVRSTRAEFAGGQPAPSLLVWLRPVEIVALLGGRCSGDQLFGFTFGYHTCLDIRMSLSKPRIA